MATIVTEYRVAIIEEPGKSPQCVLHAGHVMAAKNEIRKREMLGQLLWGLGTAAAEIVAQLAMDPEHFEIGLALLHSNINRRARSAFESGGPKSKENESEVYARMREELKGEK